MKMRKKTNDEGQDTSPAGGSVDGHLTYLVIQRRSRGNWRAQDRRKTPESTI